MIGIYKITSPTGKVYIGQSINIDKRIISYKRSQCKNQTKLYNSIVKYGFSEHIFEVLEECAIEILNERERCWQDFYNVLSERGLNCRLTGTGDTSGVRSQETIKRISAKRIAFDKTEEGRDLRNKQSASLKAFFKTAEGQECRARQAANTDQKARILATDLVAKAASTDYAKKSANTDWVVVARKHMKPINQYKKDGTLIREWPSAIEVSQVLGTSQASLTNCLKGRSETAGGFIWKYKNYKQHDK